MQASQACRQQEFSNRPVLQRRKRLGRQAGGTDVQSETILGAVPFGLSVRA